MGGWVIDHEGGGGLDSKLVKTNHYVFSFLLGTTAATFVVPHSTNPMFPDDQRALVLYPTGRQ